MTIRNSYPRCVLPPDNELMFVDLEGHAVPQRLPSDRIKRRLTRNGPIAAANQPLAGNSRAASGCTGESGRRLRIESGQVPQIFE